MSKTSYARTILRNRAKRYAESQPVQMPLIRTLNMYHGVLVPKHFTGADGNRYVRMVPTRGIRRVNIDVSCDLANATLYKGYEGTPMESVDWNPKLETVYNAEVQAKYKQEKEEEKLQQASGQPKPVKQYNKAKVAFVKIKINNDK